MSLMINKVNKCYMKSVYYDFRFFTLISSFPVSVVILVREWSKTRLSVVRSREISHAKIISQIKF